MTIPSRKNSEVSDVGTYTPAQCQVHASRPARVLIMLCRVEEHQHQLAHQCSPNIIGIWEWGICGLMGGAFIT